MHVLNIYDPKNTWIESLRRRMLDGNELKKQAGLCGAFYAVLGCDEMPKMLSIGGKNAFEKRQYLFYDLKLLANDGTKFDRINFFMHGGKYNLNRKMISMDKLDRSGVAVRRGNIGKFSEKIKAVASPSCKVLLYSCWTGAKADGFAAELSRLTGLDVIAHTTRGHRTKNPRKILFFREPESVDEIAKNALKILKGENELWTQHGGIRALKKRLWSNDSAPFEFIEEVFGG